jgi:hypothetical protein
MPPNQAYADTILSILSRITGFRLEQPWDRARGYRIPFRGVFDIVGGGHAELLFFHIQRWLCFRLAVLI